MSNRGGAALGTKTLYFEAIMRRHSKIQDGLIAERAMTQVEASLQGRLLQSLGRAGRSAAPSIVSLADGAKVNFCFAPWSL